MRKLLYLSMFVVSFAFMYLGAYDAQAGGNGPTTCNGMNCTIFCYDEPGGVCDGDEGTDGNDVFCGSDYTDIQNGGSGLDLLCGYGGMDFLHGGHSCDGLFGGDGDYDILQGGHCPDYFSGGYGSGDTCLGGWGLDVFTSSASCETQDQGQETNHKSQGECLGCAAPVPVY